MAVQGPPLRSLPVSSCFHEGRRRHPYPVTGSGRQDPQLPRRLAHPGPIQWAVVRSQGLGASAPQPDGASGQLGKEQAVSCADNLFSRCGVRLGEYDGTPHRRACQAVLNCLSSFRGRNVVPLKQFQRLLGHMVSAAAVTPLGLLHMRPLQHWLHYQVPRWAWCCGTLRVSITQQCRCSLSPWTDLGFLRTHFLSYLSALTSIKRVGDLQSIFGKRRVPCVRAGLLSRCLETPAWIRAQGSHHALPRSGGEPASTTLGGGRSSLSIAVSRKSIAHIRGPHLELQMLWAALCLPRRSAEREGCLQTEVGPLDSGGRRLGVPISRRAVSPGSEGSLHSECCLPPCVGARCLSGGYLQSCGMGNTEHLRKVLQSPCWASLFPCIG